MEVRLSNDHFYRNTGENSLMFQQKQGLFTKDLVWVSVADFNGDHRQDIYVTNDYLTNDLMYINNGDKTFTNDISKLLPYQSRFSMGVDALDINNDSKIDIITLDMLAEDNFRKKTTISKSNYNNYIYDRRWGYDHQYIRNMLYVNNGKGVKFSEIECWSGIHQTD